MEGWTVTPPDRSSPARSSEVEKPKTVIDILSNEWTDERHSMYLNSIEASFVKQLYCSEHLSCGLMGRLSRTEKNSSLVKSSTYKHSGQFEVLSQGCQENLYFQMGKKGDNISSHRTHIIPHSFGKYPNMSHDIVDDMYACQSINFDTAMEVGNTFTKKVSACYLPVFQQYPVNTITEGSDQNFVDLEYELEDETLEESGKKRAGGTA